MTKALSVTGADANGASPERRPPSTRQIVVVVERISDRGRRREGEEEAGGWDEAWRTSSITKGGTHDDGADANGLSPERQNPSTCRIVVVVERGRREEGDGTTRGPTDFFFMLVNPN